MSNGIVGAMLGGQPAEAGGKADGPRVGSQASGVAADLAMNLASTDPEVAKRASEFLEEQAQILRLQREEIPEEWRLRRGQMMGQAKEARVRRLGQMIRVGLQVITAGFGVVFAVFVLGVIYSATQSRALVIDAFEAPPALAARGISGKVAANGLLDAISVIQDASKSASAKRKVASAWTGTINVEVPQTGLSISEIERLLRARLGNDTHISGDLVQQTDGSMTLTVRGDGIRPRSFTGGPDALSMLTTQAAEYAYGEAEPALYSAYLISSDRSAEADAFLTQAYPRASDEAKAGLANNWGYALENLERPVEAIAKYRLSLRLKPDNWVAQGNFVALLAEIEGEEAAWRASEEMRRLAAGRPKSNQPRGSDLLNGQYLSQDAGSQLATLADRSPKSGGATVESPGPMMAEAFGRVHDWSGAAAALASSEQDAPSTTMVRSLIAGLRALEAGNSAAAVAPLEAAYQVWLADTEQQINYPDMPCHLGLAYGLTGRGAEAGAVFARTGRWVKCASFRADALEHGGDRAAADAAYAQAVALAPSLPFAYQRWGLALLTRGDHAGAQAKFAAASQRGPRWADPLKAWGDSLTAQGRGREASKKYAEALRHAPQWLELRRAAAAPKR
jgi:tetratricopeptide (TPR) repeat protein